MHRFVPIIAAVGGLVAIAIVVIFELTRTPQQEARMIDREDHAMSEIKDVPNEPAKWVP